MTFNGFISYSHAADGRLAPAVQRGLHRLAKPWHRRRALWIFRDQTGLAVTPGLWSSIQQAMDGSDWFVLLASPEAARSRWVNREIEHWVATKSADRILPVVTDGQWRWDPVHRDFTEDSTSVPAALRGVFTEEPLFLDLRWARDDLQLNLRHSRFRDAIAQLAAPMHGVSKDDLEGEDVRQHRRMRQLRSVAVTALLVLALVASLTGVLAVQNAQRANTAAAEALRQQQVAAEQKGHADKFANHARVQEADARTQGKRARDAAAEAKRQEENARKQADNARKQAENARTQDENARKHGENARKQAENARKQQGLADRAAARARQQETAARQQRAAAQRSAGQARDQSQLAQQQERLAQQAGEEARRQKQVALEQQRLAQVAAAEAARQEQVAQEQRRKAEAAAEEARRQEQIALDQRRQAEVAAEEARKEKANAEQQQRIAIGRRVNNQAKAMARKDPKTALMLGVAAAKVQADDEARRHLAGLASSTRYAGTLDRARDLAYSTDDVLVTQDQTFRLTLRNVANRLKPALLADLGVYQTWGISPDGLTVAAFRNGESVAVLLDVSKPSAPKAVAEIPVSSQVFNLTFSQNGRTLFVGAWDEDAKDVGDLWDVTDLGQPKPLATRFDGGPHLVDKATFSPDGKTLVTLYGDDSTGVWNLTDPSKANAVATLDEAVDKELVSAVAFLRDAPVLVIGGSEHTLLVDLSTPAEPKRSVTMVNAGGIVTSVSVSKDGRRLVTSDQDGLVTLFDLVGPDVTPRPVESLRTPEMIGATALSPDGRTVTTADFDAIATQWNVAAHGAPQQREDLTGRGEQGLASWFTPDGRSMVTVGSNKQATVWDVTGPSAPVRRATPTVHDATIHAAAVTADGRILATADRDGRVRVSDVTDPARPATVAEFVEKGIWDNRNDELAISPNGTTLALGTRFGTVVLWEVARGRAATRLGPLAGSEMPVAFSPDGRTFAVTDNNNSAASLWTLAGPGGPSRLGELGAFRSPPIQSIAFSPNGRTVAMASITEAALWDVSQARPRQFSTFVSSTSVDSVEFSRDGRTIAVANSFRATLWEFAERADPIQVATMHLAPQPHVVYQVTVTFSPDGRTLTTGGRDFHVSDETDVVPWEGNATLWDLAKLAELRADPTVPACAMTGRGLTEDEWARYLPELEHRSTCPG